MRFRQIIHEFAKFGVIGVINLFITNAGYALLHSNGVKPVTSTTVATIAATCVAYIGNRYWSFRHRERTTVARESVTFFALNGIGLLIQDGVVALNYYILSPVLNLAHNKLSEFLALNTGIAIATVFRFWTYRRFVWAAPASDTGTGATAQLDAEHLGQAVSGVPLVSENGHGHAPDGQATRRDSFSQPGATQF